MADENQPEMTDDEKAAAEWEASLAAEGGEGGAAPADGDGEEPQRILNQDEIDSLLGFDTVSSGGVPKDGIFAILDKSMTAYEKLPMIEVVFDRLVRTLSTSFRNFTSENVEISLDSMTSVRFEDYLNSIPLPALLVIFRAVEWENYGMVMVDSAQIYTIVDILLGGRKSNKNVRVEGRPYTIIEQDLVKRMVDILLVDLGAAFEPISPASFHFDRLETNPRFATISRPANPALLVKLRVEMLEDRGGMIELLLPHATLEPIRDLLLQMFMGENFGQDTVWEKHLGKELRNAAVTVETVLQEKSITLKDVMSFKVGSTLLLDCTPEDEVTLRCGGIPITTGILGKVGDNIAVSLTDDIKRKVK
ncbi:MAG: flagellar motor switch protein FliM [Alphaproteobacteria bacterium]|nr:flagellar motor switch protein FliM [Alphaproteobacteria bacterium]